ncbi:ankyrin repeat-containing domain protein [Apiospora phragmitis]|uniref:Ankyrin repeat-containing domain protein n=1 Tax=Apiospora phragmitis TaxID=2905665 RepID=A0ABR1VQN0_9PEZI
MANDVEALEEYFEKHTVGDGRVTGSRGDVFDEAIRFGSVDVYHRLVAYQKAQAAAGSDLLSLPDMPLLDACSARQVGMYLERQGLCDTVLSLTITHAGPSLLRRLIDLGAPLQVPLGFEAESSIIDATLLHIAATYANFEAIEILLSVPEERDMVNMRDELGRLSIHWAARCGVHQKPMTPDEDMTRRAAETMKLLLPHPPDVALRNNDGETTLGLITRSRYYPVPTELLSRLLERGAPLNGTDARGNTPLHHAAQKLPRSLYTIRFLLEQSANPSLANADAYGSA